MDEELAKWLNKQHEWLQEATYRILKYGTLSPTDINDLANLIQKSTLVSRIPRTYPTVGPENGKTSELRLVSIGPVTGIDALSPRTPLEFGTGNLAVVYGNNGSGKSGYARIVRKACGKPHSVELKPNVYQEIPTKRACTFKYRIDGKDQPAEWSVDDEPIGDLFSVDVFDADTGRIYLEQETELSFDPPELALFANLVEACNRVEAHLTLEQNKLISHLPDIPVAHAGTKAGIVYKNLRHDINDTGLDELLSWTAANETQLDSLATRLSVHDPVAAAKKRRDVKTQIDSIRSNLEKAVAVLGNEPYGRLRDSKASAIAKRTAASEGAAALGASAKLEGVGSDTWRRMWDAAREYSTSSAYPIYPFPYTGDDAKCVLCQQDLPEEARNRLVDFEVFVKGKLETDARGAERALQEELARIPSRPPNEVLQTACTASELTEEMSKEVETCWIKLEKQLAPLRSGVIPSESPKIDKGVSKLLSELATLSETVEEAAKKFDTDAKVGDRTVVQAQKIEIDAKKWVTQQAAAVRAEVVRLKQVEEYREWIRKTTTTGISAKAAKLSEKLITKAYIERFNDELKQLGATKIHVELVKTRTVKGRNKHNVRLRDLVHKGTRVADVLSEGERRIVALAACLADVTGRGSKSPFVFDDPISSLDQAFEEKVIARLFRLSKNRQVLVFTHRLSFLGIMSGLAGEQLHQVHIKSEPWGTGEPGSVPLFGNKPGSALRNLKNERVAQAKKIFANEGGDAYYIHAKAICSDFRILMEGIVEIVLLADVVRRHRRAVNTQGKLEKLAKISIDDCALIDQMMTKYSCYEHSQSDEAPVEIPEPDDIEKDIDRMIAWHDEFSKRPGNGAAAAT